MRNNNLQKLPYYLEKFRNAHNSVIEAKKYIPHESTESEIFFGSYGVLPRLFCNACIFTVKNKSNERVHFNNQKLFSFKDFQVTYTGIELRTSDVNRNGIRDYSTLIANK